MSALYTGAGETRRYLLMGEHITSDLSFFTLNQLDVCFHTVCREGLGKLVVDVRVRM